MPLLGGVAGVVLEADRGGAVGECGAASCSSAWSTSIDPAERRPRRSTGRGHYGEWKGQAEIQGEHTSRMDTPDLVNDPQARYTWPKDVGFDEVCKSVTLPAEFAAIVPQLDRSPEHCVT